MKTATSGSWVKGQSGNPNGRPRKTRMLAEWLRKVANRKDEVTGKTNKELIAERIVFLAKLGDVPAARLFYEYTDGKPLQIIEHSGPEGAPIEVNVKGDLISRINRLVAAQSADGVPGEPE